MTIYTADDLDRMAEYADMRTSLRPYCDISAALRQAARQARVIAEMQAWLREATGRFAFDGHAETVEAELSRLLTTHGLSDTQREPQQ